MKNNFIFKWVLCASLLFFNSFLFSMHTSIINQFEKDTSGSRPRVVIDNLSTELLMLYREFLQIYRNEDVELKITIALSEREEEVEKIEKRKQEEAQKAGVRYLIPISSFFVQDQENLGVYNTLTRTIVQLKTLNQGKLSEKTGFSSALCATHALHNCQLIRNYSSTNDITYLHQLTDMDNAKKFLSDLNEKKLLHEWVTIEDVEKTLRSLKEAGYNVDNISVLGGAYYLDPELFERKGAEGVFIDDEFTKAQEKRKTIQAGLKKEYYFHAFIVLNEEEIIGTHGHFFSFVIIKSKNNVQYIVLDTIAMNHLQKDSHALQRLHFMIEALEGRKLGVLKHFRLEQKVAGMGKELLTDAQKKALILEKKMGKMDELNNFIDKVIQGSGVPLHGILYEQLDNYLEVAALLFNYPILYEILYKEKERREEIKQKLDDFFVQYQKNRNILHGLTSDQRQQYEDYIGLVEYPDQYKELRIHINQLKKRKK